MIFLLKLLLVSPVILLFCVVLYDCYKGGDDAHYLGGPR